MQEGEWYQVSQATKAMASMRPEIDSLKSQLQAANKVDPSTALTVRGSVRDSENALLARRMVDQAQCLTRLIEARMGSQESRRTEGSLGGQEFLAFPTHIPNVSLGLTTCRNLQYPYATTTSSTHSSIGPATTRPRSHPTAIVRRRLDGLIWLSKDDAAPYSTAGGVEPWSAGAITVDDNQRDRKCPIILYVAMKPFASSKTLNGSPCR